MKIALLALLGAALCCTAHASQTGPVELTGAYPPNCLAAPLQDRPTGTVHSASTMLASVDRAALRPAGFVAVEFKFWRIACTGGRSAVLMRIEPGANFDGNFMAQFPGTGYLVARQGSTIAPIRLAPEPNTRTASIAPGALIGLQGATLVLENFNCIPDFEACIPNISSTMRTPLTLPVFNFNAAFEVFIPNAATPSLPDGSPPPPQVVSIPAYEAPTGAATPMYITGYNAGSYFDPAHPGEGLLVDVMGDVVGNFMLIRRVITLAWFTYDQSGRPFWLHGSAIFTPGATRLDVPMSYYANGAFAGAATAQRSSWGTVGISFPDCLRTTFTYTANAGLPAPVPAGTGEKTWARLTHQNGLPCR